MVAGMGPVTASRLIDAFGSAETVFEAGKIELADVPGVHPTVAKQILQKRVLQEAEKEVLFVEENNMNVRLIGDADYPHRLRQCADAPAILYLKGDFNLDKQKVLSIVGTRNATSHGKAICKDFIEGLVEHDVLIVSGMAYGIDFCAHREALSAGLPTVAVFAHGLDLIYPSVHRKTAEEMLANGGWISEFRSQTPMDKNYFPRRNRIVAGLCDGVLVVESDRKGGSLITADIANSYSREVMAVPGKPTDPRSSGCNWLIKTNRGALVESAKDVLKQMNWETGNKKPATMQLTAFPTLNDDELNLARCLQESGPVSIDSLADIAGKPVREISHLLLNLELEGVVKAMPGKRYRLSKPLASYA